MMTESTRVALVTGGSRGLGFVVARVLAQRGYGLVIGGRDGDALARAAAELSRDAPTVIQVPGDVSLPAVRDDLIDAARRLGGLDVLVNNASELGPIGPLESFEVPRLGRIFPVNVGAPLSLIQLALPLLV